jgi:chromosome segregation ATPase
MELMNRLLFLLVGASASGFKLEATSSLSFDLNAAKNRPVSKVITLLKDMNTQLQEEAKADEEIYEQMACWCETNDKEKTKAIEEATQRIEDLTVSIESLTAASTRLNEEIKVLEKEVNKNQGTLGKNTELRMKDQGEFQMEEKDLLAAISSLKAAIVVLSKHQAASLLQTSQHQMKQLSSSVQHLFSKHDSLLQTTLLPSQQKKVLSFMQQAPSAGSYAPASGEIIGILKQMKETFESNLAQTQKDETKGSDDYENLKATKEEEIKAASDQLEMKTQELATTDQKLADSKQDLEDTQATKEADEKFLANLKAQCEAMDAEFEARQKTRSEELEAVSKAMEVLSGDEAHDLFTKTFNFVQRQSTGNTQRRKQASKILAAAGRKFHNPRLVTMALQIRLDAFGKIKLEINAMIEDLMKQQADEVKHKDYCVEALNVNTKNTEKKEREQKTLQQTIDDLTMTIDELKTAIETLKAEVKEMQIQLKRAGEDREKENAEFQSTVADQRATQKLLTQALEVLKGFYDKKAALAQMSSQQEPPVSFKPYKKNESSGGVMGMIQQIINDAKLAENEAITAEADAQKAYESFVKDTNGSVEEKTKDMVTKSEEKAKAEAELTKSKETLDKVMTDLQLLSEEKADLHGECDFVLKNFEVRQSSRMGEIEALKQVLAILSGAKFSAFLQSNQFGDDPGAYNGDSSQSDDVDALDGFLDNEHTVEQE